VPPLVQEYLESPVVIWRDQDNIDFTASIPVFTTMTRRLLVQMAQPLIRPRRSK
ncbi:hypothetical protein BGZ75_002669, partial [Mortierella antarctica]